MSSKDFKTELIDELLASIQPSGYKNGELGVRCPFCGDSKDPTHYHLNIRIVPNDDQPLYFRCLRCNTTGVLNSNLLAMIGSSSSEYSIQVEKYNRISCKKHGIISNKKGVRMKMQPLVINDKVLEKHSYIEKRLGVKLDINDLHNKKIVYDFITLMKYNNIDKLNGSIDKIKALQEDHVGFLSAKNDFINFRDMTGKHKRYYIYKVINSIDTTGKFYIMPNKIDPFSKEIKTINIAEGVFDILGIYYHIFNKCDENTVYTAINGAGYLNVIKYILNQGLLCDVNVNIFSDADRPPHYYINMIKQIEPFVNDIRLFYNSIGKDYGVPTNQIKLKEIMI